MPTGTAPKNLERDASRRSSTSSRGASSRSSIPAAQFEVTTRITTVEGETFKTDGKIIVDPGWLAVYGRVSEGDGESDKCHRADHARANRRATEAIEMKESQTKPPARFNEATLLSAMEGAGKLVDDEELREAMSERGLGTPATRAQVIEGLIYEGYLLRQGQAN